MPNNYLSQVHVDNKNYKIKDSESRQRLNSLSAGSIAYDSSSSIISADDVQEAIDSILVVLRPTLTITAPIGSSLTIVNGTTTITGTATNGTFTTEIPTLGTWTITATLNSQTTTDFISITELGGEYAIELEFFTAELVVYSFPGAIIYVDGVNRGVVPAPESGSQSDPSLSIQISRSGTHTCYAVFNGVQSETIEETFSTDGETVSVDLFETVFRIIEIDSPEGAAIILTNGSTTYTGTATENGCYFCVPSDGVWTATSTLDGDTESDSVVVDGCGVYNIILNLIHIYGAEWDGSSSYYLSRTDDSALFTDPDPYMADGNHPGSSPFDNLMPWKGITVETISDNVLVKIPKFWYKITKNGSSIKFQIANKATSGFNVSPAHQDRGDGVGERDYIYVGRYHSISDYKSKSGSQPLTNITRPTGRTSIKNLGTGFYLWDYATLVTIWLLYIVEFANWDSQYRIGRGCSSSSAKYNTGATSSMPYHTGTTGTLRGSYTDGCQYRYIEDLWGNVMDWVDGIRFSMNDIYIYKNPSEFSDSSGGVNTGTSPDATGYISSWSQPSITGYDWAIYPDKATGSNLTHITDYYHGTISGVVLCVGGDYTQDLTGGLFRLEGTQQASRSYGNIGVRVMYLPSN